MEIETRTIFPAPVAMWDQNFESLNNTSRWRRISGSHNERKAPRILSIDAPTQSRTIGEDTLESTVAEFYLQVWNWLAVATDFLVEPFDFGLKSLWFIGYQNILDLDKSFLEAIANFKATVGVGFIFAVVDLA